MFQRHRIITWGLWLIVLTISVAGLRYYRVDNDLADWMPDLVSRGPFASYAVIGFERGVIDAGTLAQRIGEQPTVAFCIDPAAVKAAGYLLQVTPEDFVVGEQGNYLGVFAFRDPEATDRAFLTDLDACLAGVPRADYAMGGPAVFHLALNEASQQRLPLIMALLLLLGGILLFWITRSVGTAVISMIAIVFSQIILMGVLSWRGQAMDMATSMVPPLMMALGFSYAAHRAVGSSSLSTLLLCFMTTALSLATFAWTGIAPVRSFAFNGIFGLALVWLAVLTLVPPSHRRSNRHFLQPLLGACGRWSQRNRYAVPVVFALSTFLAIPLVPRLRFESNPLKYFPHEARVVRDFHTLNARLTGMLPSQVVVVGTADARNVLQHTAGMRKVIDVRPLAGTDRRVYWCLADNNALGKLAIAQSSWQEWAAAHGVQLEWRGVAAQLEAIGELLMTTALLSLPAMALVAGLVIGIIGRSLHVALIGVAVNLFPVIGLLLVVAMARWPLDLPSLMIGAITIGVAIDDTLHLTRACRRYRSVWRGMIDCWRPCVGSSLVAAAGMGLFILSPFGPTTQFGILLGLAILFALAGDFLLLPRLLAATTLAERSTR